MIQLPQRDTTWRTQILPLAVVLLGTLVGCSAHDAENDVATTHRDDATNSPMEIPLADETAAVKNGSSAINQLRDRAYHVYPGQEIQPALELAANDRINKVVKIHAGTYRPLATGHALIYLNRRHDGITIEAEGEVILTAANSEIADKGEPSYPAIVNHVVYFGDGISQKTVLRGCRITGANGFLAATRQAQKIEPDRDTLPLAKGVFFHSDGGAIKIFGRSYPTIENVTAFGNSTNLCGGAISVEHGGFSQHAVRIRNCAFLDNHCPATGAAIDLLPGSAAVIQNCLFVGNVSNTGMDRIKRQFGLTHNEVHGSGALTVFENSRAQVDHCTFTGNWNGVDDRGKRNTYHACIFWMNTASDGSRPGLPYELDILDATDVTECYLNGNIDDLRGTVNSRTNTLHAPDPQFDSSYRPQHRDYERVGYRPVDNRAPGQTDQRAWPDP